MNQFMGDEIVSEKGFLGFILVSPGIRINAGYYVEEVLNVLMEE